MQKPTLVVPIEPLSRGACTTAPVPAPYGLAWDQRAGRACVVCGQPLTTGAVSRGWIYGKHGAHRLDVEVWCCPKTEEP